MNNAKIYLDGKLIGEGGTVEMTPPTTVPLPEPWASKVYEVSFTLTAPTRDDRLRHFFRAIESRIGEHRIGVRVGDIEAHVSAYATDTPETFMHRALAMLEEAAKARGGVVTPGQNVDTSDNA